MALGARPSQLVCLVLRRALWMLMAGAGLGLAGCWFAAGALHALLYRAGPLDAGVLGAAALLVAAAGLAAAWAPARSATRITPGEALRCD